MDEADLGAPETPHPAVDLEDPTDNLLEEEMGIYDRHVPAFANLFAEDPERAQPDRDREAPTWEGMDAAPAAVVPAPREAAREPERDPGPPPWPEGEASGVYRLPDYYEEEPQTIGEMVAAIREEHENAGRGYPNIGDDSADVERILARHSVYETRIAVRYALTTRRGAYWCQDEVLTPKRLATFRDDTPRGFWQQAIEWAARRNLVREAPVDYSDWDKDWIMN